MKSSSTIIFPLWMLIGLLTVPYNCADAIETDNKTIPASSTEILSKEHITTIPPSPETSHTTIKPNKVTTLDPKTTSPTTKGPDTTTPITSTTVTTTSTELPDTTTKASDDTTTTSTPKPTPTTTTTASPNTTTTAAPSTTTTTVAPSPKPNPVPPCGHFDGPSFIGGIVLTLGLIAIGLVAYKFYKARNERNYHTL